MLGAEMADDEKLVRHEGGQHVGAAHASPYPTSRLAPVHDLVDVARQIQDADAMLGAVAHGKLQVIAEQIRALQIQAREIIETASRDAGLHRAECRFRKRVGQRYHLYRRADGTEYFSMLAPQEWGRCPHEHVGAYELQIDMSWRPVGSADDPGA
jgi:hypothetical protein